MSEHEKYEAEFRERARLAPNDGCELCGFTFNSLTPKHHETCPRYKRKPELRDTRGKR